MLGKWKIMKEDVEWRGYCEQNRIMCLEFSLYKAEKNEKLICNQNLEVSK